MHEPELHTTFLALCVCVFCVRACACVGVCLHVTSCLRIF